MENRQRMLKMITHKNEDPRSLRSKKVFKEATIALLNENPTISKLTVKNISDKAALNRATFYLHFKDVNDILRVIVYEIIDDITIKTDTFFQDKSTANSDELVLFLDYFYTHRKIFTVFFEYPQFKKKLHNTLLESLLINDGLVVENIKFKNMSKDIIAATLIGVITWWLTEGIQYSSEYIAEEILKIYK